MRQQCIIYNFFAIQSERAARAACACGEFGGFFTAVGSRGGAERAPGAGPYMGARERARPRWAAGAARSAHRVPGVPPPPYMSARARSVEPSALGTPPPPVGGAARAAPLPPRAPGAEASRRLHICPRVPGARLHCSGESERARDPPPPGGHRGGRARAGRPAASIYVRASALVLFHSIEALPPTLTSRITCGTMRTK